MAVYLILLGALLITSILELFHVKIIKKQQQMIYWGLIMGWKKTIGTTIMCSME